MNSIFKPTETVTLMNVRFQGSVLRLVFQIACMASGTGGFTVLRRKRKVNTQLWTKSVNVPSIVKIYVVRTV
jgi:hypothetical protein